MVQQVVCHGPLGAKIGLRQGLSGKIVRILTRRVTLLDAGCSDSAKIGGHLGLDTEGSMWLSVTAQVVEGQDN